MDNSLSGDKTLTPWRWQNIRADLALQEQHRQLIEKILSGDMQSGLVFTCQIGGLPEETFKSRNSIYKKDLTTFHLSIQAVSPLSEIDFNDVLGMASSLTVSGWSHSAYSTRYLSGGRARNTDGVKTWYQFVIRPEMWVMTLKQDSRIFQDTTVPHILETLLNESHIKYDKQLYHPESIAARLHHSKTRNNV